MTWPPMQCRQFMVVALSTALLGGACVDLALPSSLRPPPTVPAEVIDAAPAPVAPDAAEPDASASDTTSPVLPDAASPPPDVRLPLGRRCAAGADCESGSCADGVCCATACTALCYAC